MHTRHPHHPLRALACACLALASLAGCDSALTPDDPPSTAGKLHDDGVRYVLARLELSNPASLRIQIVRLAHEYCVGVRPATGMQCANQTWYPTFPLDGVALVDSVEGSPEFKQHLRSLVVTSRAASTLTAYVRAVDGAERSAGLQLRGSERAHFADAAAIARSSATLWAPTSQGGRNGGDVRPSGWDFKPIDWNEVAEVDMTGCLVTLEFGCVEGAIIASTANIIKQLAED